MDSSGSSALDRMTDAFFAVDEDWRFTYLNERGREVICEAAGRDATVAELEGADIWEEIPAAVDTVFYERYHEAMATQEPVDFEAYYDPLATWFAVRAYPDDSGLSVYFRDVTERKEREHELEQYRTLTRAASDVIVTIDEESVVRSVNPAVEATFGYAPDELVGEPVTTLMFDENGERHEAGVERYLATGEGTLDWDYVELTGRHADGSAVPVGVSFSETVVDGERYFTGIVRDITDRKERERERERREAVLAEIYQVTADKSASLSEKVDTLLAIGREVLGAEYGALSRVEGDDYVFEVVHDPDGEVEAGDVVPLSATNCERAIATERTLVLSDVAAEAPDLAERAGNVEWGISCYLGTPVVVDGEVYGTFCFYDREARAEPFTDWEVTLVELMGNWVSYEHERVRREAELRRERDRLDGFAGVLSHDLRNPLSVAAGRVDLVREEHDGEHLQLAAEALDRMGEIIEDVMTIARSDRGDLAPEPRSLSALAREAWTTVDAEADRLTVAGDATVVADDSRTRRLLENLFANAVTHGGADVTVTVGPLENGRGFFVADDGPGIPEDEREAVFEPGHSGRDGGTGFGLHIVETVAEAHGWDVAVTESEGGGARFEVTGVEME